jgi:hypothetical protein
VQGFYWLTVRFPLSLSAVFSPVAVKLAVKSIEVFEFRMPLVGGARAIVRTTG